MMPVCAATTNAATLRGETSLLTSHGRRGLLNSTEPEPKTELTTDFAVKSFVRTTAFLYGNLCCERRFVVCGGALGQTRPTYPGHAATRSTGAALPLTTS